MSEPELASELKANIMLNGSGLPLPKDTGWEAASEKKDEGENTLKTVEVERKEEKKDDDAKMEEMEDEKVVEAEDAKITEPDDAKETKAKDVKVAEAEDGKVAEVERAKIVEFMDAKVEEPEDVTMMDAEAQKDGDKGRKRERKK
ncbi:uncharacterized protein LOC120111126 [Phoenix dactylifera]|uniref:Uncharacterized protein LOC120111126 n=1 Tax=Phoenix dactylifera TaxID=42345 RepID=A0A8B9AA56_PHODC|nr:uncharacterized protein LOC120111126 [Phoenix dactylifera]